MKTPNKIFLRLSYDNPSEMNEWTSLMLSGLCRSAEVVNHKEEDGPRIVEFEFSTRANLIDFLNSPLNVRYGEPRKKSIPMLGELDKGEHRLISLKTVSMEMDERTDDITIKHKVEVQEPEYGNCIDFYIIQTIERGRETWGIDLNGDPSEEQLGRWLKAAAFAMEVKSQVAERREISIYFY